MKTLKTMKESGLFTPYVGYGKVERVRLMLNDADRDRFNMLPREGGLRHEDYRETIDVTDTNSGRAFTVRRADCGSQCYCAAEIVKGDASGLETFV